MNKWDDTKDEIVEHVASKLTFGSESAKESYLAMMKSVLKSDDDNCPFIDENTTVAEFTKES